MAIKISNSTIIDDSRNINNANSIGIGTINPTSKLYVVGDTYISGISTLGTVRISSGIVTATSGIVTYYGDGSKLSGINASGTLSISTNTTNQAQYIPYATSFGSTTGLGVTTLLVYNPSTGNLGIGTTNSQGTLQVGSAITMYGSTGIISAVKYYGDGSALTGSIPNTISNIDVNQNYYPLLSPSTTGTISSISVSSSSIVFNPGPNYLGIGSTTPTTNLDVFGNAYVSGILTASSFSGDGSRLTGISGGFDGFNVGIDSSVQVKPLSYETALFTFPSTAGRQYVVESINVANVDTSVGIGTTVNIIASIEDTTGEKTYIAYNVPIVNGGLLELLKNPIVAGPSNIIRMWTTNTGYVGVNIAAEVYINYSEYTSTAYINSYRSTVSIATTDLTTVYTSTTYPTVVQSIHLANRTDTGDYPVSVTITNGLTTTYLARDLVIPRYATVDILDRPKRIEIGGKIGIMVAQTSTIDVIIAGKKITS